MARLQGNNRRSNSEIASRLAMRSETHGFDVARLAKESGRPWRTVNAHFGGKAEPSFQDVVSYAYTLAVGVDALLFDDDQCARFACPELLRVCESASASGAAQCLDGWVPQLSLAEKGTRTFAARLRLLRRTHVSPRFRVSVATGLSLRTWRDLEVARRSPSTTELATLSRVLGVSANALSVGSFFAGATVIEAQLSALARLPCTVARFALNEVCQVVGLADDTFTLSQANDTPDDGFDAAMRFLLMVRGFSYKRVRQILQVGDVEITAWLQGAGMPPPRNFNRRARDRSGIDRKATAEKFMAANTQARRLAIAKAAGVTPTTVRAWTKRFEVPHRRIAPLQRKFGSTTICAAVCRRKRMESSVFCDDHHRACMGYFKAGSFPALHAWRSTMTWEGRLGEVANGLVPAPFEAGKSVVVALRNRRVIFARSEFHTGVPVELVTDDTGLRCLPLTGLSSVATYAGGLLTLSATQVVVAPPS